jgi:hypothetical protein
MFRFDYRFSDANTFFVRYNTDNAYVDNPTDALGTHNVTSAWFADAKSASAADRGQRYCSPECRSEVRRCQRHEA